MHYFGHWRLDAPRTPTPTGARCIYCDERIAEHECGVTLPSVQADGSSIIGAMHRECFLRTVTGSIGHQLHKCSCHSGTAKPIDDPPELTVREAAKLAVEYFKYRGSHDAKQT